MSVLMTMRVQGDTEKFRQFVENNADEMRRISDDARSKGCLAHQFGIGDGYVLVIDEWESPEAFQSFFEGNAEVENVMRESGAQGEPEISFAEAVDSADRF
jgi:heme-degrading monooxygenase HmoA